MVRSLFMLTGILAVVSIPAFAGLVVTPEPKLGSTAVSVGAIVLIAEKLRSNAGVVPNYALYPDDRSNK